MQYDISVILFHCEPFKALAAASKGADNQQRYFKITLNKPSNENKGGAESKGWWWAHFDGRWIARQMEIHDGKKPLLLVAG